MDPVNDPAKISLRTSTKLPRILQYFTGDPQSSPKRVKNTVVIVQQWLIMVNNG